MNEESAQLIENHLPLVKHLVKHFMCRLPPQVQFDDLMQAGMIGLIEAANHFQNEKGVQFSTFATFRIKGSILDEIRRQDWVPRSVYKVSRQISQAVKNVENRLGRDAKDAEVAEELGMNLEAYYELLQESQAAHLYGFDDVGMDDDHLSSETNYHPSEPQADAIHDDFHDYLANIIHLLPKNEQLALSLYYEHELQLKEIGELMGISESRVSQILSQATHRIRARITEE